MFGLHLKFINFFFGWFAIRSAVVVPANNLLLIVYLGK
jgi:hypothetical protein